MKKVLHVQGHDIQELDYTAGMELNNGDVYGLDDQDQNLIWIWIGSKSTVEESTVAAWFMNKLDQERGGVPEVITIEEGKEPMAFNEAWSFTIVDKDTPGFLKQAELDLVEFKLFRVYIEEDTAAFDEAKLEEVDISRASLASEDVFVLDGNDAIYCWIGNKSQVEEKRMGQKLMQKIDANRHFMPLQYTIYEGDNDSWEDAFFDLLDRLEKLDPAERKAVSVEDTREQEYVAEESQTVEEHKEEVDTSFETTDPDEVPERVVQAGTDEHREMVSSSDGSPVVMPGSSNVDEDVAEEVAEIPTEEALPVEEKVEEPIPETVAADPEPTEQVEPSSSEEGKSKNFGGAPVPDLSELEEGPDPNAPPSYKPLDSEDTTETPVEPETAMPKGEDTHGVPVPARKDEEEELPEPTIPITQEEEQVKPEPRPKPAKPETVAASKPNKVKTDCAAHKMHAQIWRGGNSCHVCGMSEKDCPESDDHRDYWIQKEACPTCEVASR